MAQLVPKISTDKIKVHSERKIAEQLSKLPDDVLIYHHYPILSGTDRLREGEIDFIVLFPKIGFLVLEVKGGIIQYQPKTRTWHAGDGSKEGATIRDPFEQARDNHHYLHDQIKKKLGSLEGYHHGHAVIFSDSDCASASLPPGANKGNVFTAKDLPYLSDVLEQCLIKWGPAREPVKDAIFKQIREAIESRFDLTPNLLRQVENNEDYLLVHTNQQRKFLDFIAGQKRAVIYGVAGSGKTMLAMEKAEQLARLGLRVLFICYSKDLAIWVKHYFTKNIVDVYNFHNLCKLACDQANIAFTIPTESEKQGAFWNEECPALLEQAIVEGHFPQYDAIIADEAQDFEQRWWETINNYLLSASNNFLYLFADPEQNIFNRKISLPIKTEPYRLNDNCRNSKEIVSHCASILGREINTDTPLSNIRVHEHSPKDIDDYRKELHSIISFLNNDGIPLMGIAILSPFSLEKSKSMQPLKDNFTTSV